MSISSSDTNPLGIQSAHASTDETLFKDCIERIGQRTADLGDIVNAGERLKASGATARAVDLYKSWIAYNPAHPLVYAAYFNYGILLSDIADRTGAINALREATRIKPTFYAAHINLGSALERLGEAGPAVEAWTAILTLLASTDGDAASFKTMAIKQIARILETSNKDAVAEDYLRQSLDINPHQGDVIQHWVALRQRQCKWPLLVDLHQAKRRDLAAMISPLSIACYTDDPLLQLATAYRYCKTSVGIPSGADTTPIAARMKARRPGPLRIGYVSSDLREHAVGFSLTEVMELHDRTRCEIFAYYCGVPSSDATHQRIKSAVDHWRDLTGRSDSEGAQAIRGDEIDILIDLNGYTKDARTKIFALRPAPIAVNWFGFPGSMGTPYHHYIIADEVIIPRASEHYYSETVLRLPCYQPNDRKRTIAEFRPGRSELGLPETGFVFCSFNGMQKITARTFDRWMTILAGVEGSILWLLSGTEETNAHLRACAVSRGIAGERLIFADKRPNPQHLARYPCADLFLDAFPYGAHTTASDALWMGVPVLTLAGRSFASRVCASLLTAAGLAELICTSDDDYVTRAIALARAPDVVRSMGERLIRGRDTSALYDAPRFVERLEGLYQQMADDGMEGLIQRPKLANLDFIHEIGIDFDLEAIDKLSDQSYELIYSQKIAEFVGI